MKECFKCIYRDVNVRHEPCKSCDELIKNNFKHLKDYNRRYINATKKMEET